MAELRSARKVRTLAAELRDQCALLGVHLVAGEAEDVIVAQVRAIAQQLGVTERTALDSYLTDTAVRQAAQTIAATYATRQQAADTVEPILLSATDVGRVLAAVGMTVKLAAVALEQPDGHATALGVATDAADAIVGVGVALNGSNRVEAVELAGQTLVLTRTVIQQAIQLIRAGTWPCPCRDRHAVGSGCDLQRRLAADLGVVGGWVADSDEPPADRR